MSTPVLPGDLTPAGLLFQLHQCRMLCHNTDSDWETHLTDWLNDFWRNIEMSIEEGTVDATNQSPVMQISPLGEIAEFEKPVLNGWSRIAGALAYELDEEICRTCDRRIYQQLIDWCFKEIAENCSTTDDMLCGSMFQQELREFAEAWDVPAIFAVLKND